ncbi:type II secretion system F family protein [Beggiatoa leptomitoformis]|uniref:Type II secretion system F family protein n=1 Tax=Beggiatoa leptomitoformis TaxID=288004 RepID=A0A2N9YDY5_9GAMM|nr:type II secretion system F family protein [Beggiatoa leptomitoformis]ALG68931.1 type II secretion system F family protein [Beggiatoa leptomitoformis]AUI68687.1 type II secretion system F family protein [Beggiatoa leptomitoformis]
MRYKYQALDQQGQEVSGILMAETEREASRQLQKRDLTPLVLTALNNATKNQTKTGKPKRRDYLIVLHELATLLESDVSLIEAVDSLAHSSHHAFITQAFAEIASQLRQGTGFAVALHKSQLQLPWYVYQLLEAGELTGKVPTALRDGVEQMEYETRVAGELRNAMIYPIILILSGIGAVLMIFTVVVPRFANILKTRGDNIPFLAKAVLETGMFLNTHWLWIITGVSVISFLLAYLLSQARVRQQLHDTVARLPLLGVWIVEAETARWSAMMGTLLENRVSLVRALELAGQGVKLPSLQARLTQVNKAVRMGTSLSQALQDNEALSPTGHNLIRAGERSGQLPKMLKSLGKLLEESGRTRMKRMLAIIEPVSILVIGGVIGLIITGVILAITSVNDIKF